MSTNTNKEADQAATAASSPQAAADDEVAVAVATQESQC